MAFVHDVLVVGAGLAGLRAAVELAGSADVAIATKVFPTRSHSGAAQGGVAAALGNEGEDRWEWHLYDTIKGGDWLADEAAAEVLVRDAPRAVLELEHLGVPFNRTAEGRIAQRAFGGHTRDFGAAPVKRACFASDRTGRVILDTLYEQALKRSARFYTEFQLVDLDLRDGRCSGATLLDLATGELHQVRAKAVLLATGGFGKLFATTSNCTTNTGDALSLCFRAGLPLEDLEFVQFHPTGIRGLGILISEAARGEGGILRNRSGERFMERYAPAIKDLAPRDLVARAIVTELRQGRGVAPGDHVHLDLTHLGRKLIDERLWEIASFARTYAGVDPAVEPIPVLPTCHYMMGGLPTDVDGRVLSGPGGPPVEGLFAAGECACVSVHGANRLGCNSLLDLIVFGRRTGRALRAALSSSPEALPPAPLDATRARLESLRRSRGPERVARLRRELQEAMSSGCGIFRTESGLLEAQAKLAELRERFSRIELAPAPSSSFDLELTEALELDHFLTLGQVMVASALARRESRGAHAREDFPERDDERFLAHTFAFQDGDAVRLEHRPVTHQRHPPARRSY